MGLASGLACAQKSAASILVASTEHPACPHAPPSQARIAEGSDMASSFRVSKINTKPRSPGKALEERVATQPDSPTHELYGARVGKILETIKSGRPCTVHGLAVEFNLSESPTAFVQAEDRSSPRPVADRTEVANRRRTPEKQSDAHQADRLDGWLRAHIQLQSCV